MTERNCRYCGVSIAGRAPQARSCAPCRRQGARRHGGGFACESCGDPIDDRHVTARTCRACYQAKQPIKFAATRSCLFCAAIYRPRATNQMTCSPRCRYLSYKFRQNAAKAASRDLSDRPCYVCGTVFTPRLPESRNCSRRCIRLAWARANPLYIYTRRSQTRSIVLKRDWLRLIQRYDHRCAYCEERKPLTADHIVPLSRGGQHAIGNLLPACRSCNSQKHTRLLVEWRRAKVLAA